MEVLKEAQRLIVHINDSKSTQPVFLEGTLWVTSMFTFTQFLADDIPSDGDHSASSGTILKRRAQALIIFVGFALKVKGSASELEDEHSISPVIAELIAITSFSRDTPEGRLEDISEAARTSLAKLLSSMSVTDFIDSIQSMLLHSDVKVSLVCFQFLTL